MDIDGGQPMGGGRPILLENERVFDPRARFH